MLDIRFKHLYLVSSFIGHEQRNAFLRNMIQCPYILDVYEMSSSFCTRWLNLKVTLQIKELKMKTIVWIF